MEKTIKVVETKNGSLRFYTLDEHGKCVAINKREAFHAVCRDKARFVDSFKTEEAYIVVFVNHTVAVDAVSDKIDFSRRISVKTVYDAKIIDGIARATGKFFEQRKGLWGNDGDKLFPITNCTPAAKAYIALNQYLTDAYVKTYGEEPDCYDIYDDLADWARGGCDCADGMFELYDFFSEE